MKNNVLNKHRIDELQRLQKIMGVKFHNLPLLNMALTHSSYAHETYKSENHNEKLEFLGDALLSFIIIDYLYTQYTEFNEGDLSRLKSYLVCEDRLYSIAMKLHLNEYLMLGKGEELTGGRNKKSLLSDAIEALIAAYYLDSGLKKCKEFVIKLFKDEIENKKDLISLDDYKSQLQKYTQKLYKLNPEYYLIEENGPDHNKTFKVGVKLNGKVLGIGIGPNKRTAEKKAAQEALKSFD